MKTRTEIQELVDYLRPILGDRILTVSLGLRKVPDWESFEPDEYQERTLKTLRTGYRSFSAEDYHGDRDGTQALYRSILLSPNMNNEKAAVEYLNARLGTPEGVLGMINTYLSGGYL